MNQKYPISEWAAAEIRRYYQQAPVRGGVQLLAKRLGLPAWRVSRYATAQGWAVPTHKGPKWSQPELDLLAAHHWKCPDRIRLIFKRNGYHRSASAIVLRRKKLGLRVDGAEVYSARRLAEIMGVNVHTVIGWIDKELLRATRKGTRRDDDIYQITHAAVRQFLLDYTAHWDHRKADKYWLIDILSGNSDAKAAAA